MTQAQLKKLGFKKVYCEDKSAYWHQMTIKCKYIPFVQLIVENNKVNIWSSDVEDKNHVIIAKHLPISELVKIILFFDNGK